MTNRRNFIRSSGALAFGSLLTPNLLNYSFFEKINYDKGIGIQTFTTREFTGSDARSMFQQLAEIGIKNIETYSHSNPGYYGFTPKELKSIIEDLGMKWISHHVGGVPSKDLLSLFIDDVPAELQKQVIQEAQNATSLDLTNHMQQLVDEASEGGLQYLTCGTTLIRTMKEIESAVDVFSRAGEACNKAGLQFAYHNHAWEWDPIDGGASAYDLILSQTDKDRVKMELDLGWVAMAKKDPVELFKSHPGRFPLVHIKDINLETKKIVPIGKGTIDFAPVFKYADLAGMKYFFLEQDTATSINEVRIGSDNLKRIVGK